MVGDGVNKIPAPKASGLAIAQGARTQIAKGVADLVLADGDFAAVPELVHQGRQTLRNLQRVARLNLTRSAFAAFLILTIGTTATASPLLPRHLTIAAAVTMLIRHSAWRSHPALGPGPRADWYEQPSTRRCFARVIPAAA